MTETHIAAQCPACGSALSSELRNDDLCPGCLIELALESPGLMAEIEGPDETKTLVSSDSSLSSGSVLGNRYRIRSALGHGGMGEVWRAYDVKLRVDVALKAVRKQLGAGARALEILRQEVRTAREVISANVCRVFDLEELEGQELVSMEYVDGTTLLEILSARSPLDLGEAQEIASQFLAGLEAIHAAGLVHRDIKPENLMITRTGRVVVMDFGLAKGLEGARSGTISGTPAYMAPEQAAGQALDPRADVFSAAVVLAEMVSPGGIRTSEARRQIWEGIRRDPPELADTPWASVLKRALDREKGRRHNAAAVLARALEEVSLRAAGDEDVRPYPGLASFTMEDAEYFFGRELEVEEMWKKLRRPHLLALIGPSGAGKSSFLRAGLLAAAPADCRALITTPGNRPLLALGRALTVELSGDSATMEDLLVFDEPDVAVSLFQRWRRRHGQGLVIVDQFEELFTQNGAEVQAQFAGLLARLAVEADVHVLLAMRDDFLFECANQPGLTPIFSALTPLKPLSGFALRRALVQPALKCGYRFEDDALVDRMVDEVGAERGALPLLAFAASRLWEKRDRGHGLLLLDSYEEIGGVGGALAQHAEATLEKIGQDRLPQVRELFRNLVTPQGTRAARDREELLSIFAEEEREAAGKVLATLIDARLVTAYDARGADEDEPGSSRVEIIHESLLSAWPRLVRWQTQDQEGAQIRDELRQGALMWEQHGRSQDLLWTGTAFREFQLWRERYPGGLSELEERFSRAMERHALRLRRRRRLAVAAVFTVLLAVLITVAAFWRQSERSEQQARSEARRAEAAKLLALGRLELDEHPSAALAYALESLELHDDPASRLFALEALWRGPTAFGVPLEGRDITIYPAFSPDGEWLGLGTAAGVVMLWRQDGSPMRTLAGHEQDEPVWPMFTDDSRFLVSGGLNSTRIRSLPDGREVRRIDVEPEWSAVRGDRLIIFSKNDDGSWLSRSWALPGGEAEHLGTWRKPRLPLAIDPTGNRLAYAEGSVLYLLPLARIGTATPRRVGSGQAKIVTLAFDSAGDRIATGGEAGEIRIWSLSPETIIPLQALTAQQDLKAISFSPSGSQLATAGGTTVQLFDLEGPPDAEPLVLRRGSDFTPDFLAFHPSGRWLATATRFRTLALWPLGRDYPRILRAHTDVLADLAYTPNGSRIVSSSWDGTVRVWPLTGSVAEGGRLLVEAPGSEEECYNLDVDSSGSTVAVGCGSRLLLVPLGEGRPREMTGFSAGLVSGVAFGPRARQLAASFAWDENGAAIRVWDLESGEVQVLDAPPSSKEQGAGGHSKLEFIGDGRLLSGGKSGVWLWDLQEGSHKLLRGEGVAWLSMAVSPDARHVLTAESDTLFGGPLARARFFLFDLMQESSRALSAHGERASLGVAFDPSGRWIATGDGSGFVRVGPVTGEEPHLLFRHEGWVRRMAFSPTDPWLASGGSDGTIRLWPLSEGEMKRKPLHTLPYEKFLARLRTLTNLRAVRDEESPTAYRLEADPFPGWQEVPTW